MDKVLLLDLSTNGTFVNGVLVGRNNSIELSHGDLISLAQPCTLAMAASIEGQRIIHFTIYRPGPGHQQLKVGEGSCPWHPVSKEDSRVGLEWRW